MTQIVAKILRFHDDEQGDATDKVLLYGILFAILGFGVLFWKTNSYASGPERFDLMPPNPALRHLLGID